MSKTLFTICSLLLLLCFSASAEVVRFDHLSTVNGIFPGDNFGCYVSPIGKWAAPGADYFSVGIPGADSGLEKGSVKVMYMNPTSRALQTYATFIGENNGDKFGDYVSQMTDITGDGKNELLVGAPHYNDEKGRVYVYAGGTTGSATSFTTPFKILSPPFHHHVKPEFGESIAAGNVSNTTYNDVLVGAPGVDDIKLFEWKNVFGTFNFFNYRTHSEQDGSDFGRSIAVIGDVNDDGYDDYVVGAPKWVVPSTTDTTGKIFVYSGDTGDTLWTMVGEIIIVAGPIAPKFGFAVSKAGDWDNDGIPDVLVGAYRTGNSPPGGLAGKIYVYDGENGDLLFDLVEDEEGYAYLGYSVAGGEDFGNDGTDDIIVGAPGVFDGPFLDLLQIGRIYVFEGGTGDTLFSELGTTHHFIPFDTIGYAIGYDVNFAGDLDGDGRVDIVVSGPLIELDSAHQDQGQIKAYLTYYLGDVDFSQTTDFVDVVYLDDYVADPINNPAPIPLVSGDIDLDGEITSNDVACLAFHVLLGSKIPCN